MGTTDGGFSRSGSSQMQQLLRFGATFCVATVAIALSLPSSAGAKTSPSGQQNESGRGKHPDHKRGKREGDGPPTQGSPNQGRPANGSPGGMTAPAGGDSQPVTAFRFPAVKVDDGVVTFRPRGISPKSIRSAFVKYGHKKRRLSLDRVRAAARRGVLRIHMAALRVSHHSRQARVSRRKKQKPTLIIVTDPPPPAPAPAPTPEPAPAPVPAPTPVPSGSWRAPGSPPLSDAEAKALVTPKAETRLANASANHYLPTESELAAFHSAAASFNPLQRYVSGGFTGTTDEILQWGAEKWGIPEDVVRAVAVTESYWRQDGMGDRRDGVNASLYPAQSRIDSDSVYESLGITQIKWRPDGSLHPGTEPLRWKTTAFNVDYWGASIRYYYDGLCSWCSAGYGPGQAWESVGAWYSPNPWQNAGMLNYITTVKGHLANRTWEQAGF